MQKTLLSLSVLASCVAHSLYAQETTETEVERITVTGEFRDVTIEQLSASATILSASRLLSRQPTHLDAVLNAAPNVNFTSGASRGRFVQIRGIGERSQFSEPVNPSVSFFVDDFDFSGLAATGLLFDTQQLEVFRGPQATLFGTGALAGAIKITSNRAGEDAPRYIEARAATQDSYRIEGATGGALSQNWDYRIAAMHNRSDGFVHNTFLGRDDTNNLDESAARLALSGQLSESTEVHINYRWYDIDNGYDAFSLDNDRNTRSDEPGFDRHQTHALSIKSITSMERGDLVLIASHAAHDIGYAYDEDWTFTGFHPFGYTSTDTYLRDISTQIIEARFVSAPSNRLFNDTTDWIIGALYKTSEEQLLRQYTFSDADFSSVYRPDTSAVYAQTTTAINARLSLEVGIRLESYDFSYADNTQLARELDTNMVGGKVALQYQLGQHFVYSSVSRGYKGAGFNPDQRVSTERRFFDEEYNVNYEIGFKSAALNDDLTLRAAVFWMDRRDTQVSDFDVLPRDDGSVEFVDIIGNADRGTNQGAEVELSFFASDKWRVDASVGYLDAYFEGYTAADGTRVEKRQQAQAPRWTANVFSEVLLHDNLRWRIDVDYKDRFFFSDGHDVMSPFVVQVNTEMVWRYQQWDTTFWIQNLFDRTIYTRGFGGFSNDPRDAYAFDEPYFQLANGRQAGVTVRYQF